MSTLDIVARWVAENPLTAYFGSLGVCAAIAMLIALRVASHARLDS